MVDCLKLFAVFVSVGSAATESRSACDAYDVARVPTVMVKAVQTSAVSLPLSKVVVATQYMSMEAGVGGSIRSDFSSTSHFLEFRAQRNI